MEQSNRAPLSHSGPYATKAEAEKQRDVAEHAPQKHLVFARYIVKYGKPVDMGLGIYFTSLPVPT